MQGIVLIVCVSCVLQLAVIYRVSMQLMHLFQIEDVLCRWQHRQRGRGKQGLI
jgi:uncharacterized protein HemY